MLNRVAGALLILGLFCFPARAQVAHGFTPCLTAGQPGSLSATVASSNVQLSRCGPTVILYNITSTEAFYNLGQTSTTVATTSSASIPGNTYVVLNVPNQQAAGIFIAAITAGGATTLRVVQGVSN